MAVILEAPFFIVTEAGGPGGPADTSDNDFTRYDGYLDSLGVLYLSDGQQRKASQTLALQPRRTDVGQSEFETRPEFGDFFSQGDFSHGQDQQFFHRKGRDERKYLYSKGFDISEPGKLKHLNDTAETGTALSAASGLVEFDSLPFCFDGTNVKRHTGTFPGTWSTEDPHAGEGAVAVEDLTTSGGHLYAALGVNGIHRRDTAGTWASWNTGTVSVVEWAKDRLMAAEGRTIYEITASGALPTALDTLPEEWEFTSIFENGPFILATAWSLSAGLSRVYTYGPNSDNSALERKTSTPMPKGDLIHIGIHYLGRTFLGGGHTHPNGDFAPVLYEAQVSTEGDLQFLLIAHADGADAFVHDFEVTENAIIFPWTDADRGIGLGIYHLHRNAFATYLTPANPAAGDNCTSVLQYQGRIMFTAGGAYYEDLDVPVPQATLLTSVGDFNNVGLKTWDLFKVTHSAMIVGTSISLEYTKKDPELGEWETAFVSTLSGSSSTEVRLPDIRSTALALRLISTPNAAESSPEINSFSVRSTPSPGETEWTILRTIRVIDRDRKDRTAQPIRQDPRSVRNQLEDLAYRWVTLYEPGQTWIAYVQSMTEIEPEAPIQSETGGTREREAYYMEMRMIGRRTT